MGDIDESETSDRRGRWLYHSRGEGGSEMVMLLWSWEQCRGINVIENMIFP
jgi:hypothetical protein